VKMGTPAPLENRKGELFIDGVSALNLAELFGTPLYVTSETRVRENYRKIYTALNRNYEKIRVHYSAKANTSLSVLKILESEGAYLDAVSIGEVFLALKGGFPPERILFTGTNVRNEEFKFLLDSNVMINVDSLSELNRMLGMATPELLSVRLNPEVGAGHHEHCITAGKNSKFGLWENSILEAYETAQKAGVKRFGIHMHIGSGILTVEPFVLATENLLDIANKVHILTGIDFEFIDIGGGIGVPYRPEEKELDLTLFSNKVLNLFRRKIAEYSLGAPIFCVEPGRYIVCDAGVLLTAVNTVKVTPFKKFVGVDAGFNTLVRPAMYGSYHPIIVANKLGVPNAETYDVEGPLCESGDILAKDRSLPKIEEGDVLAVLNAGAYGFSMSSQYNSMPRAAEVLVKNGKYKLIRERESLGDLAIGQKFAGWLK
jgi:diaminopimelate decarboxylase